MRRALLLAAGKGTRLGALSRSTPKCLQIVGSETIIDRLIRQLRQVGVEDFLVNTHHLSEKVFAHFRKSSGLSCVEVVYEPELLGTLGTLKANLDFFKGEPGWVLHADNFISGSFEPLKRGFESRPDKAIGTMLTFTTRRQQACGIVKVDEDQMVTTIFEDERAPIGQVANAATFLFSKDLYDIVARSASLEADISKDLIPRISRQLNAVHHHGEVIDIGTPEGLISARTLTSTGDSQ